MGGHHWGTGEASHKAQPDPHRPTGACNTDHIMPTSRLWAVRIAR